MLAVLLTFMLMAGLIVAFCAVAFYAMVGLFHLLSYVVNSAFRKS